MTSDHGPLCPVPTLRGTLSTQNGPSISFLVKSLHSLEKTSPIKEMKENILTCSISTDCLISVLATTILSSNNSMRNKNWRISPVRWYVQDLFQSSCQLHNQIIQGHILGDKHYCLKILFIFYSITFYIADYFIPETDKFVTRNRNDKIIKIVNKIYYPQFQQGMFCFYLMIL